MPVAAAVGAADERVTGAEDRLTDPEDEGLLREKGLVPEPPELLGSIPEPGLEHDLPSRFDAEARGVERRLRVGSFAQGVDELDMALRLHRGAHDAEGAEQPAVLEEHAWDERVERTASRAQLVRVAGRLDPLRAVRGEVVGREPRRGRDRLGDGAGVEGGRAVLGDPA